MSDSMDEELERSGSGGAAVARGSIPDAGPQHQQYVFGPGASAAGPQFGQATTSSVWARKRGRVSIGVNAQDGGARTFQQQGWGGRSGRVNGGGQPNAVGGGGQSQHLSNTSTAGFHVGIVRGRESPDSDMSSGSGSSDVSINRGIKRMRLNEHQHQHQRQHQQQMLRATSAFGPYSSPHGGNGQPTGVVPNGPQQHNTPGHHRQRGTLLGGDGGVGGLVLGLPFSAPISITPQHGGLDMSSRAPAAVIAGTDLNNNHHNHGRPPPLAQNRAISDGRLIRSSAPTLLSRSSSGGSLNEDGLSNYPQGNGGSGRGGAPGADERGPYPMRSASFDTPGVPTFAPYTAQPPAQARYVRGIRVEANAPSDVDYSNVNHALRQLHMERRMAAERAAVSESGANGPAAITVGHGRSSGGGQWPGMRSL